MRVRSACTTHTVDTIAVAILRNGSLDVNTDDPDLITAAKDAILQTIDENGAKLTINGVYNCRPATSPWPRPGGRHRRGPVVSAKGREMGRAGYWRPDPGTSMTDNDLIAIPTGAKNPRLAHEFINFFLDERVSYDNFRYWNGYQPPLDLARPGQADLRGRAADPPDGGRESGHVPRGPDAVRAAAGGRSAVAGCLDRDQGGCLRPSRRRPEPMSTSRRHRRREGPKEQRSGVWYPRWYWPSFTLPAF